MSPPGSPKGESLGAQREGTPMNALNGEETLPGSPAPVAVVEVTPSELHGHAAVFCPNPKMPLWSTHPRVFIDVATTGQGRCAYCGTVYRLAGGPLKSAH